MKNNRGIQYGYRSGFEHEVAEWLNQRDIDGRYEQIVLQYEQPAKQRKYTADFVLPNGIIIETKGRFTVEDRQKHLHIRESNPGMEIRFVFQNPNTRLYKGAKSTYADWCNKKGFKYAKKEIPEEWLNE